MSQHPSSKRSMFRKVFTEFWWCVFFVNNIDVGFCKNKWKYKDYFYKQIYFIIRLKKNASWRDKVE